MAEIVADKLYTVKEFAKFADVSTKTIYRWCKSGRVKPRGLSGKFRFLGSDISAALLHERDVSEQAESEPEPEQTPVAEPEPESKPKPKRGVRLRKQETRADGRTDWIGVYNLK